jgi:putative PIN family toxin of toxin-antitoxin system
MHAPWCGIGVAYFVLSGTIGNTVKKPPKIVIDTNVLVSALKSRNGWSFQLLAKIGKGMFEHVVTVPLLIEYEDVLHRKGMVPISRAAVDDVLDYVCASGQRHKVHFLWRPKLTDARDDMVLEAAFNGQCDAIVTWNVRDFPAAAAIGIDVLSPDLFVKRLKDYAP